jgi:hypothetical protein
LHRWVNSYQSLRRLYPLWVTLYRSNPEIALFPPLSPLADALAVRDLGFRLCRRVIEIRDGLLTLQPYIDPRVAEMTRVLCREAGLADEEAQAVVEAASLAAALRAKEEGRPVNQFVGAPGILGGIDLTTEVATLERVARCYARSSIMRTVLARIEQEDAASADFAKRVASGS